MSTDQLTELVRSGVVAGPTLVWREGLANWTPYSEVARNGQRSPAAGAIAGRDLAVCAECGFRFPKSDTVQIEGACVCADCKPIYLQKLREGIPAGSALGIWRSGRLLVTKHNVTLPRRCLKCNAPKEGEPIGRTLHRSFTWRFGVAFVFVCEAHRAEHRKVITISRLLMLGGFTGIMTGVAQESIWTAGIRAVSCAAFLGGLIYQLFCGKLVSLVKMNKEHMWLSGCGPDFLAGFPEWNGPR